MRAGVLEDALKGDNVGAAAEVLENLDLTLDILFLDWLERVDHALLVVCDVDGLEDLAVLSAAQLPDQLIIVLKKES